MTTQNKAQAYKAFFEEAIEHPQITVEVTHLEYNNNVIVGNLSAGDHDWYSRVEGKINDKPFSSKVRDLVWALPNELNI